MIYILLTAISAYLLGSIPTGYIFGRVMKGIDIRRHGSGNVGATNVFRTVGKIPGVIALLLDFLKGFVAVTLLPALAGRFVPGLFHEHPYVYIFFGAAAIAGHIWTIFLRFKGGKGVATSAGVITGLDPLLLVIVLVIWIIVFWISKIVSLSSIAAATALPVIAVVLNRDISFVLFYSTICMLGIFSHRSNIRRLIRGEEKKIL